MRAPRSDHVMSAVRWGSVVLVMIADTKHSWKGVQKALRNFSSQVLWNYCVLNFYVVNFEEVEVHRFE